MTQSPPTFTPSPDPRLKLSAIGLVVNTEREGAVSFAQDFTSWLRQQGIRVCATHSITDACTPEGDAAFKCLADSSDLVVVCGGDGSLLGASRKAGPAGKPMLGVHWGGMGFLNECQPEEARDAIRRIQNGDYRVEERLMLRAQLWRDGAVCAEETALNDVAVTRDSLSRILRLEVSVGTTRVAQYQGDGILVSTPTGSTGHSLSAGGPVVDPRVEALLITPICPHAFNGRSIVAPTSERITVLHSSPLANVILTIDGQLGLMMRSTDRLEVTRAPWAARFIRLGGSLFYRRLSDKLQWML